MSISISDDEPMVRRLGEENEEVAIISDGGGDVVRKVLKSPCRTLMDVKFFSKRMWSSVQR